MNRNIVFTALVSLGLILGCESKQAATIPTTPPVAAKQPHEILDHLKYMAVRKDPKHAAVITPIFKTELYGNAWWFHKHAGEAGIPITEEEITTFGLQELKDMGYLAPGVARKELTDALNKLAATQQAAPPKPKAKKEDPNAGLDPKFKGLEEKKLDMLPAEKEDKAAYDKVFPLGQKALNAGLYRLMKGIPDALWNDVVVMDVKQDTADPKIRMVFLGIDGTPILQVNVVEREDKTFGVMYVQYKVAVKKLEAVAKKKTEAAAAK